MRHRNSTLIAIFLLFGLFFVRFSTVSVPPAFALLGTRPRAAAAAGAFAHARGAVAAVRTGTTRACTVGAGALLRACTAAAREGSRSGDAGGEARAGAARWALHSAGLRR